MARLTRSNLLPPIRPDDIVAAGPVTIVDTVVDVPAKTRSGKATYMVLTEYPGKGFYLNETDKAILIEAFGTDDTDAMRGKKIPIHVRIEDNFRAGPGEPATVRVVRVPPLEEWAEYKGVQVVERKRTRK